MIEFINKYNLLKKKLNIGDVVNSRIIKQITRNKAIADIKGFHVVVKSDFPLKNNNNLAFLISGFNEKDKIILLKQINNNNNYQDIFNKLIGQDNFIKKYLKQHQLPINVSTLEIADYLYLKDKKISIDKLRFIFKYLKYFFDIPLIYKLYQINLNEKNLILLLTLFQSFIKKSNPGLLKEKNKESDNYKDKISRFILKGDKDKIIENLKFLSQNNNLLNDLLKLNKNENPLFFIYPLIVNSDSQSGYIFNISVNDKRYSVKFVINSYDDIVSFKLNFNFDKIKINYSFFYFIKESESLMIVDTNTQKIRKEISSSLDGLEKKLKKFIKGKFNIFIKGEMQIKDHEKKNLDIYI